MRVEHQGNSSCGNKVRAREWNPTLLSTSKKHVKKRSPGDAEKCRAPLRNTAGKVPYPATRNTSTSLPPLGPEQHCPGCWRREGERMGVFQESCPWPSRGSCTCQLPTLPRAVPFIGSSCWGGFLGKQMSFGEFKALSWRPDSDCTLNYVCLDHYAVIHIYFRHQYCLKIFPSSQCYLYASILCFASALSVCSSFPESECLHIILINIFIGEGFAVIS